MSEEVKHIKDLTIENFKCFEHFEMKNISQFNLILGDNNVGKTTLLESLLFDENLTAYLSNLISSLDWRNLGSFGVINTLNYLDFYLNKNTDVRELVAEVKYLESKHPLNKFKLQVVNLSELSEGETEILKKNIFFNQNDSSQIYVKFTQNDIVEINSLNVVNHGIKLDTYLPFIASNILYNNDLVRFYSDYVQVSKGIKNNFIQTLSLFIPDVEDVEISTGVVPGSTILTVRLNNLDEPLPLSMFGDGAIKLARIVLEILACKGKRLMIDEIDTGIHYSRFKDFWKTILKAAEEYKVQLFVTTHNNECLKYFKEALEDDEMQHLQKQARSFTLRRLPDDSIKAYKYDFDQFEHSIEQGIEIRGGK